MKKIMFAALVAAVSAGCGKSVDIEGKGMYANINSGTVGIGEIEVVTYPEGVEGSRIEYEEDTAWLSPETKTHAFKIDIVGTNSCSHVSGIVSNICAAFIASAPKIAAINNGIVPARQTKAEEPKQPAAAEAAAEATAKAKEPAAAEPAEPVMEAKSPDAAEAKQE